MKNYEAPTVVEYGSLLEMTSDFGGGTTPDTIYTPTGQTRGRGGSLDTCVIPQDAAPDAKCLCRDNVPRTC